MISNELNHIDYQQIVKIVNSGNFVEITKVFDL